MCIILGTRQMYRLNALTAYLMIVLRPCFSLLDPSVSVSLNEPSSLWLVALAGLLHSEELSYCISNTITKTYSIPNCR